MPEIELIALKDSEEIGRWLLDPGVYTIGASSSCSIALDAAEVAPVHSRMSLSEDGTISVEASGGSLTVDGEAISASAIVLPNQTIGIGGLQLLVQQPIGALTDETASLGEDQQDWPVEFKGERYRIGRELAKGGMGAILEARQSTIRRSVAMKVILGEAHKDSRHRWRFIEEAQITGQLEHPNIVPVHDCDIDAEGRVFYTMKLVQGITLKKILELLKKGTPETVDKYSLPELLTIFQKVCDAVAFAHSKGVIHRDLKPANIMIGSYGEVLVMDWGLAKVLSQPKGDSKRETAEARLYVADVQSARADEGHEHATMQGTIVGTLAYMAPEQARGEVDRLDQRADIFALGCILYELLTLERPFPGNRSSQVLARLLSGEPPVPPSAATSGNRKPPHLFRKPVPESLSAIAMTALAFDVEGRYQSVKALQADLTAYQNGFATLAERASSIRRFTLFVQRHKGTFLAALAILLTALALGTKALLEGNRSRRALADLKRQAPALCSLGESEARSQQFESAVVKLDAAIALDPEYVRSYWQRAWVLIGLGRMNDSVNAIQLATKKDPSHNYASILPTLQSLGRLNAASMWPADEANRLYNHLMSVDASGECLALSQKLRLGAEQRANVVKDHLDALLGRDRYRLDIDGTGVLTVDLKGTAIRDIEPLRGLPIDALDLTQTNVTNLEPITGLKLVRLWISNTDVADLTPLRGMPLRMFGAWYTKVSDVTPLRGAPLEWTNLTSASVTDFAPLDGVTLKQVEMQNSRASDLSFLRHAPIEWINAGMNVIEDLSPLKGKPLRVLLISRNRIRDLSPLADSALVELDIADNPDIRDVTPLLSMRKLEKLRISRLGSILLPLKKHPSLKYIAFDSDPYRSVEDVWRGLTSATDK
jgi:serine/threonine protein kinase